MAEIVTFKPRSMRGRTLALRKPLSQKPVLPRLHEDVRTYASLFSAACSALLSILSFGLVLLMFGLLYYDGAFLGATPNGLCIGLQSCSSARAEHLGLLSLDQRVVIAAGLGVLCAPALMILAHLRGLFRLYAAGIVFTEDNIAQISRVGWWLLAYSTAPFLVHRLLEAFAIFPEQSWFRVDEAAAVIIGVSLLLVARVIACGGEIEQHRDLFI